MVFLFLAFWLFLVDGSLDGVLAKFRIGHVARDEDAAAALFLDGTFRLLGIFMLVEIGDGDIGTLPRVEHGNRASNPRVAAGDKCNHSCKLALASVVRRVV